MIASRTFRYVLLAGSLLLAADKFTDKNLPWGDTVTATVLQCLVYGFSPAIVGCVIAWMNIGFRRPRNDPEKFSRSWNAAWAVLLILLVLGHFIPQFSAR